jgi:hypothetical protein
MLLAEGACGFRKLRQVVPGSQELPAAKEPVQRRVAHVEERAAGEELPAKPVDPGVQFERFREPGDRQRPAGQPRELVGQVRKLGADERPGGGTVVALGVKIPQGRFPPAAEVGGQCGQSLDRVAGVREEDGVGGVGPARGEERQRVADDRAREAGPAGPTAPRCGRPSR